MEANKQSMTLVTKNQLSWRELQEVEEAKRRDRIERRKQELTMMSAMPSCIAESMSKGKKAAPGGCDSDTRTGSRGGGDFKAEDPSKVMQYCAFPHRWYFWSCVGLVVRVRVRAE